MKTDEELQEFSINILANEFEKHNLSNRQTIDCIMTYAPSLIKEAYQQGYKDAKEEK